MIFGRPYVALEKRERMNQKKNILTNPALELILDLITKQRPRLEIIEQFTRLCIVYVVLNTLGCF